jgi:hypothetical protein
VIEALEAFGAPLHGMTVDDFSDQDFVLQLGVAPVRVDIITSITGVEFDEAWPARLRTVFDGEPVSVLSRQHLIQNKSAAGRPQDIADVDFLKKLQA